MPPTYNVFSNALGARHRIYRPGPRRGGVLPPFGPRSPRAAPRGNLGRRLVVGGGGSADICPVPDPISGCRGDTRHLFRASSAAVDRRGTGRPRVGRSLPFLSQSHVRGSAVGDLRPGRALRLASPRGIRLRGVPLLPFGSCVLRGTAPSSGARPFVRTLLPRRSALAGAAEARPPSGVPAGLLAVLRAGFLYQHPLQQFPGLRLAVAPDPLVERRIHALNQRGDLAQ